MTSAENARAQDVERGRAGLALHLVLGLGVGRGVVDDEGLGRHEAAGAVGPQGLEQVVLQLGRQPVGHADGARLVDGDAPGVARVEVLAQVGHQPLFAVEGPGVEEPAEVAAEVGADGGGLEAGFGPGVEEQVGVAVAVPAGDAVAAEELEDGVGGVLAAEDDPEVGLVAAHQRQQVPPHLVGLDRPLALGAGAYQLGRGLREGRRPRREDEDDCECQESDLPKRHPAHLGAVAPFAHWDCGHVQDRSHQRLNATQFPQLIGQPTLLGSVVLRREVANILRAPCSGPTT